MLAAPRRTAWRRQACSRTSSGRGLFVLVSAIVAGSVVPNANGVGVVQIFPNSPARMLALAAGDIITELNGTATTTNAQLSSVLSGAHPGQTVPSAYYSSSRGRR